MTTGKWNDKMNEKDKIYFNIWCCAYRRITEYKGTSRELRELETAKMCLKIAKWWKYEEDRRTVLNPSHAVDFSLLSSLY